MSSLNCSGLPLHFTQMRPRDVEQSFTGSTLGSNPGSIQGSRLHSEKDKRSLLCTFIIALWVFTAHARYCTIEWVCTVTMQYAYASQCIPTVYRIVEAS